MEYSTKFNPGQEVWTMYDNKPHQFRVAKIEITLSAPSFPMRERELLIEHIHNNKRNNPQSLTFDARKCYATKQELIDNLFNNGN